MCMERRSLFADLSTQSSGIIQDKPRSLVSLAPMRSTLPAFHWLPSPSLDVLSVMTVTCQQSGTLRPHTRYLRRSYQLSILHQRKPGLLALDYVYVLFLFCCL